MAAHHLLTHVIFNFHCMFLISIKKYTTNTYLCHLNYTEPSARYLYLVVAAGMVASFKCSYRLRRQIRIHVYKHCLTTITSGQGRADSLAGLATTKD